MTINAKNERSEQVANVVKKVIWVVVVLVFGYFYAWDRLLSSLDGSVFKTALILIGGTRELKSINFSTPCSVNLM